jgi:hypothetical protein
MRYDQDRTIPENGDGHRYIAKDAQPEEVVRWMKEVLDLKA